MPEKEKNKDEQSLENHNARSVLTSRAVKHLATKKRLVYARRKSFIRHMRSISAARGAAAAVSC